MVQRPPAGFVNFSMWDSPPHRRLTQPSVEGGRLLILSLVGLIVRWKNRREAPVGATSPGEGELGAMAETASGKPDKKYKV